ncbi:unnamed protein product [Litomosoides sigmodontis]|uniref:Uncharacterized protein n=1 Tax=Litomosoides sigmodontis TaxID=42156 RepID=A0A3P6SF78_LITSI|nr:unnamed protein product [Litomosoides sigmodontis]
MNTRTHPHRQTGLSSERATIDRNTSDGKESDVDDAQCVADDGSDSGGGGGSGVSDDDGDGGGSGDRVRLVSSDSRGAGDAGDGGVGGGGGGGGGRMEISEKGRRTVG